MKVFVTFIALCVGIFSAELGNAAIITGYNTSGSIDGRDPTLAPSIVAPGVTGSLLQRGPGLGIRTGTSLANAGTFTSVGFNGQPGDYVFFGFVVDPGFTVSLDNLQIGVGGSLGAPNQYSLFSSVDNYTTSLGSANVPLDSAVNEPTTFNLSSLANLQGAVEFRLFASTTTSIDGGTSIETARVILGNYFPSVGVDSGSFAFNGTVTAVPEPSSIALLAFGTLGVVGYQRRRILSKKTLSI